LLGVVSEDRGSSLVYVESGLPSGCRQRSEAFTQCLLALVERFEHETGLVVRADVWRTLTIWRRQAPMRPAVGGPL
jgi:hypothetical protein